MIAKAKLLLLIGIAAGAFWGGWWVNGNRIQANALEQYQEALQTTQDEYNKVLAEQHALYEAAVQESITLEKQNRALADRVAGLREEISHVTFIPQDDGVCAGHPVDSPEFRLLYDKAASGGDSEGGAGDSVGVSPRDD